jgi:hypothetical protein
VAQYSCSLNISFSYTTNSYIITLIYFKFHLVIGGPSEGSLPSGCCSRLVSFRLLAASQRKLGVVGPVEYLPCPGFFVLRFQWCHLVQHRGLWSYRLES